MKEEFIKTLNKVEKQEKYRGVSLVGPQKDDFIFYLNDKEAKAYTSQGEKKSIIFSLKVAEIDMLIKEKGEYPIFLIDDISSYFDSVRKESIINYFKGRDVQLFLSSTDDLGIESKNFNIYEGDIIEPRDS
jgi:DNA replication and repair protein RecF